MERQTERSAHPSLTMAWLRRAVKLVKSHARGPRQAITIERILARIAGDNYAAEQRFDPIARADSGSDRSRLNGSPARPPRARKAPLTVPVADATADLKGAHLYRHNRRLSPRSPLRRQPPCARFPPMHPQLRSASELPRQAPPRLHSGKRAQRGRRLSRLRGNKRLLWRDRSPFQVGGGLRRVGSGDGNVTGAFPPPRGWAPGFRCDVCGHLRRLLWRGGQLFALLHGVACYFLLSCANRDRLPWPARELDQLDSAPEPCHSEVEMSRFLGLPFHTYSRADGTSTLAACPQRLRVWCDRRTPQRKIIPEPSPDPVRTSLAQAWPVSHPLPRGRTCSVCPRNEWIARPV